MIATSAWDRYQLAFARWQAARHSGRTALVNKLASEIASIAQQIDPMGEKQDLLLDLERSAWDKYWKEV